MGQTPKAEPVGNHPLGRSNKDSFEKLLLAEYDYQTRGLLGNEELGEKRVSFFITLTTAVLAALVAITGKVIPILDVKTDPTFFLAGAVVLLLFGTVTLMRIIHRNIVTDDCKQRLDRIRRYFVSKGDEKKIRYLPYEDPYGETPRHHIDRGLRPLFSLHTGGLVQTVALMNSVIATAAAILLSSLLPFEAEGIFQVVSYGLPSLVVFITAWAGQMIYVRERYNKKIEEQKKKNASGD